MNEINSKQASIEIEQLNARVVEAEMKLKTEVQRIKKKMQIQITELELSLDVANKNNIDLQKTIKKQSLTLTVISILTSTIQYLNRHHTRWIIFFQELQAHYDEVQRQLQVTLDQLGISQRRLQSLTAELEEIRGNYESVSGEIDSIRLTWRRLITMYSKSSVYPTGWEKVRRANII